MDQFVTLACISNPLGGPLISTTLWTGVPFREVLAQAGPASGARYVSIESADGYHEEVDLGLVNSDPRIMLVYAWDGEPLPAEHGFPLRIFIPDRYGMKQPKWITGITLTADSNPGYWVTRGWDPTGEVKTTSVIDTVATKSLVTRDGQTYVPIGGIAHAGAKGISKIEVQIDDGSVAARRVAGATVRADLGDLALRLALQRRDTPPGGARLRRAGAAAGDRGDRLPHRLRGHRALHRTADHLAPGALRPSIAGFRVFRVRRSG